MTTTQTQKTTDTDKTFKNNEDYWLHHLEKRKSFKGTDRAYCKEHNIRPTTFASAKKRYSKKVEKISVLKPPVFQKIPLAKNLTQKEIDPLWLAKFLKELL